LQHVEESLQTPKPAGFVPSLDDAIYGDLASRMSRLYLDADDVFAAKPEGVFITEEVDILRDPVSGAPYVELRASTPVQMSVHDAVSIGHKGRPAEMKQSVSIWSAHGAAAVVGR
jgi:hypothetical protein